MLVLLILLITGVIARKTGVTDEEGNKKLSRLLINICQSAMIINSTMSGEIDMSISEVFKIIGVSAVLYVFLILLSVGITFLLHDSKENRGTLMFMCTFGNVGFMGFPVIASIFGSSAVFYASLFNIPFNLLIYTLGIALISGGKGSFDVKKLINVPLISTLAALLIFLLDIHFPKPLAEAVGLLGDMVVPAAMIIIGTSLGNMSLKQAFGNWRLYIFAVIKLIAVPAIVYFLFSLFVRDQMILGIATVMASLPVATNGTMLCLEYGGNETLASSGTFLTTVASVATIPLMVYLLLA